MVARKETLVNKIVELESELQHRFTLEDIVIRLLGNIRPIGKCEFDEECESNIQLYKDVAIALIVELQHVSEAYRDYRLSVQNCGLAASQAIADIQAVISDTCLFDDLLCKELPSTIEEIEGQLICPNCNSELKNDVAKYQHCYHCGQTLKWRK